MQLFDILILCMLALPAMGAFFCALVRDSRHARLIALAITSLTFLLTIPLLANFNWHSPQPLVAQFIPLRSIPSIGFHLNFGVDAISICLLTLPTFLMPLATAASFPSIKYRPK